MPEATLPSPPDGPARPLKTSGTHSPTTRKIILSSRGSPKPCWLTAGSQKPVLTFLNLWDRAPGSGEVNLDLARISIRTGDADQAIRYFRSAIYGSWDKDPAKQRRNTRLELCEFLLQQGRISDAQAEIAGLAADTPEEDGALLEKTGQLFSQAGEPGRALSEFEEALRINPRQNQWLEEAGRAAFTAGDYTKAETFLARADRENPSAEITGLRNTVRDVLDDDPFLPGLSDRQQAERSWRAYQQGLKRLGRCTGTGMGAQLPGETSPDLQGLISEAHDLKVHVNLESLARQSDLRNEAMQFVFHVEEINSPACGSPDTADQALLLIVRRQPSSNP